MVFVVGYVDNFIIGGDFFEMINIGNRNIVV